MGKSRPLEVRFWEKVNVQGPNDCWEWQASKHVFGYGQIGVGGRPVQAHRVSWLLAYGPIPEGSHVLHHCDNPPCVNPAHLWLGTHADNMRDKERKGRGVGWPGPRDPAAQRWKGYIGGKHRHGLEPDPVVLHGLRTV